MYVVSENYMNMDLTEGDETSGRTLCLDKALVVHGQTCTRTRITEESAKKLYK